MKRIICIGNRLLDGDAAGPRVYDCLTAGPDESDVEIIDGGIAGLNLLGLIDGTERIVFVDSVSGYAEPGRTVVLTPDQVPLPETVYDHGAGLSYLFTVLSQACDRAPSEVYLVGIEGPAGEAAIADAAMMAKELAAAGLSGLTAHAHAGGKP